MRINKFIAYNSSLSRRSADEAILNGRVRVNGIPAVPGTIVSANDTVFLDGKELTTMLVKLTIVLFNKPPGYVCSKDGQGSPTIFDLLPHELKDLNTAGRLDKDSSGLVLLTNNGELIQQLTHPSNTKEKTYEIELNKPLALVDEHRITKEGVKITGKIPSVLNLQRSNGSRTAWKVTMSEGRNRQIRRTFAALNYKVITLHRTHMGEYNLNNISKAEYKVVN